MEANIDRFLHLIDGLPLGNYQRDVIKSRYIPMLRSAENSYSYTYATYAVTTTIITVASVVITALIPLDKLAGLNTNAVFWITFGFSIALTLANKFMHAFSMNQKYIFGKIYLEKLRSEGWSFISGTDKYASCDIDSRFTLFCSRIEHLRMKSLEIDGNNPNDMIAAGPNTIIDITDTKNSISTQLQN